MGYEILLVIPFMIIFFSVIIRYSTSVKVKYVFLVLCVFFVLIFAFVVPGPLGLMKKPPFVYWIGGQKGRIYWILRNLVEGILRKAGFEW